MKSEMKPETERNEILKKGLILGMEFAFLVITLIFLGYFLGSMVSDSMAMIGMVLGAFLGWILGIYHLVKKVS
jgi:F0F1-type ATP synthase assembly protein I